MRWNLVDITTLSNVETYFTLMATKYIVALLMNCHEVKWLLWCKQSLLKWTLMSNEYLSTKCLIPNGVVWDRIFWSRKARTLILFRSFKQNCETVLGALKTALRNQKWLQEERVKLLTGAVWTSDVLLHCLKTVMSFSTSTIRRSKFKFSIFLILSSTVSQMSVNLWFCHEWELWTAEEWQ